MIAGLLARTLGAIRCECPLAWCELVRQGDGLHLALAFGDERFTVRGDGLDLRVGPPEDASIRVEASVEALTRVIMGEHSLVDSVVRDEVFIAGDPAALVRLDRLTWLFVAGAARSESTAPLLDELLKQSARPMN